MAEYSTRVDNEIGSWTSGPRDKWTDQQTKKQTDRHSDEHTR